MNRSLGSLLTLLLCLSVPGATGARSLNGFELEPASVPPEEILHGGPPRDGIPALDHPPTISAEHAPWDDASMVIGVDFAGEARAYPVALLDWHELANDTVGERPILVSWCPLCGTGMVFDRRAGGRVRLFGVSGLLYRSDLLLYDHETESLWSQISSEAVTGPALGTRLRLLSSRMMPWGDWRRRHPRTRVLAADTGHDRPYERSPYAGYARSESLRFPAPLDPRYHPKMPTLGLRVPGGPARAYPAVELMRSGGEVREEFAGDPVRVAYDAETGVFSWRTPDALEVVEGYWFAWMAFHPDSSVFASETRSETQSGTQEEPKP